MDYYKLKENMLLHPRFGELPKFVIIQEKQDNKVKIFAETDISYCKYWLTEEDFNKYYELVSKCDCSDCGDKDE